MSEDFLQYIWRHRLLPVSDNITTHGERLKILDPGKQNTDAGPDFFNARIIIDDTTWAGNVEVHINASDWDKHGHNLTTDYANVILHVVRYNDKEILRNDGTPIPVFELPVNEAMYDTYRSLMTNQQWIPCEEEIRRIDPFVIEFWVNKLTISRLERKANDIKKVLERNQNNWEETFYQFMARAFGFRVNADPFERLARSVPLRVLAKHKNDLPALEAILFGQSGLLEPLIGADDYYQALIQHYQHYKTKFGLSPIPGHNWKFSRLRPSNFPTLRIAQFAVLIHTSNGLLSQLLETKHKHDFMELINCEASSYWDTHYQFNKPSKKKSKKRVGEAATESLLINAVAPFLFVYGQFNGNDIIKERALELLDSLQSENNSIIRKWLTLGITAKSAFKSQGLLQLKNEYCSKKKCLHCEIGNNIIKKSGKF